MFVTLKTLLRTLLAAPGGPAAAGVRRVWLARARQVARRAPHRLGSWLAALGCAVAAVHAGGGGPAGAGGATQPGSTSGSDPRRPSSSSAAATRAPRRPSRRRAGGGRGAARAARLRGVPGAPHVAAGAGQLARPLRRRPCVPSLARDFGVARCAGSRTTRATRSRTRSSRRGCCARQASRRAAGDRMPRTSGARAREFEGAGLRSYPRPRACVGAPEPLERDQFPAQPEGAAALHGGGRTSCSATSRGAPCRSCTCGRHA